MSMLMTSDADLDHGDVGLQQAMQGVQAGAQKPGHNVCVVHQVVELQLGRAQAPRSLCSPLHGLQGTFQENELTAG